MPTSPFGSRATGHESRLKCKTNPISTVHVGDSDVIYAKKYTKYYEILQNNPKIYSQKVYIPHHFSHSFPFFFYYFYALFCTFCPFFQLLNINTLNSMYNKDLHKYFTCLRQFHTNTGHGPRGTRDE